VQTEPASTKVPYRIVLIEDNRDASASLKKLLQLAGHKVAAAFDGVTGVQLVLADRPQIVLCDIGLPGMDGYAVTARLRVEMKPPLPIMIAITGYGQPEDRARALAAGFDHHLVKPLNPDDLLRLIAAQGDSIPEMRRG
jgi:CheY-like chemotaxis protein